MLDVIIKVELFDHFHFQLHKTRLFYLNFIIEFHLIFVKKYMPNKKIFNHQIVLKHNCIN